MSQEETPWRVYCAMGGPEILTSPYRTHPAVGTAKISSAASCSLSAAARRSDSSILVTFRAACKAQAMHSIENMSSLEEITLQ